MQRPLETGEERGGTPRESNGIEKRRGQRGERERRERKGRERVER
jgi:hypothetical protein